MHGKFWQCNSGRYDKQIQRSLYAKLLKAKGESERAKEYLAQAIDMFQQMGMTWDLAQAEQALQES